MIKRILTCAACCMLMLHTLPVAVAAESSGNAANQSDNSQPENNVPPGYEEIHRHLQRAQALKPRTITADMHVLELHDGIWLHRSYIRMGDQRLHANGLFLVTASGITVIDSPWTPTATYDLLDWLDSAFDVPIQRLVVTHAHDDRLAGIDAFIERGIPVYSSELTADTARLQGLSAPNYLFDEHFPLRSANTAVELFYPGPAHSDDNTVVWFPDAGILFGGCMLKSATASSLGFTGDADEARWPGSLQRAVNRYPQAELFVPGHGLHGGKALVENTLELLDD